MNLGVVIGYGVSETKEMAQNWRGADMFCVIVVIVVIVIDCTCGVCVIVIVCIFLNLNMNFFFFQFHGFISRHSTVPKEDRLGA